MKKLAIGFVAVLLSIVLAVGLVVTAALAGHNCLNKVTIHIKAHPTSCSESYPVFASCADINTTYPGTGDVDVMPVFFDLVEFTSVEFGISWWYYTSMSMAWTRCKGDASAGTIVHSGDMTTITWTACQYAWSLAPGFGWLTVPGPEWIQPTNKPVTGRLGVVDCAPPPGPYFDWSNPCGAGIGGIIGDDPCAPYDAVQPTSWGAIKALLQ